jgi:hypothetical protein
MNGDAPPDRVTIAIILLLQQCPARRDNYQSATYLDDGQRYPEKRQHVRANRERGQHQDEAIHGDAAREQLPCFTIIVQRERQKYWAAADRIHDREQGADDQENALGSGNKDARSSRERRYGGHNSVPTERGTLILIVRRLFGAKRHWDNDRSGQPVRDFRNNPKSGVGKT